MNGKDVSLNALSPATGGQAFSLTEVLRARPLDEKILFAPSPRVAGQWLDAAARSGTPALHVRVKTLRGFAIETSGLADACPSSGGTGKEYLRGAKEEALAANILGNLRRGSGYFSSLDAAPALARALVSTIRDMRLAGLSSRALPDGKFDAPGKGEEMRRVLALYEKALAEGNFFDYADALRAAAKEVSGFAPEAFFLMPRDMEEELRGLERALWEATPKERRIVLDVDEPSAQRIPPSVGHDALCTFSATGEVNEVREIFRRCAAEGIPFDDVEVLYTDGETYVPLLYEEALRLAPDGNNPEIPVTFAEGVPARYGRPARALALWAGWVRSDFAQPAFVKLLEQGLLLVGKEESSEALAGEFAALPVGAGRARTLSVVEAEIARAQRGRCDEDDVPRVEFRAPRLKALQRILAGMLEDAPKEDAAAKDVFGAALAFLDRHAHDASKLDGYVLKKLKEDVAELREACEGFSADDAWAWLHDALRAPHIAGERPMPGKLHAAPWRTGGHSGRRWTFVLGLDEGRFPGAGLQDPFLLDGERGKLSPDLPTAGGRLEKTERNFHRLLARLRGNVVLSYSSMNLEDEREQFPAHVLLAARGSLQPPAPSLRPDDAKKNPLADGSFIPSHESHCLDEGDWWMLVGRGGAGVKDAERVLARSFPHLGRGFAARDARKNPSFTEFDGFVPEAGRRMNPFAQGGPVFSAGRLERFAQNPMEYFLKYVLEIESREIFEQDPARWLDPMQKGSLLHDVFRAFMTRLAEDNRLPDFARDEKNLSEILEAEIRGWRNDVPPPNEEAFRRDTEELRRAARIFLREEERFCRDEGSRPRFFEVSVGMEAVEGEETPLDSPDPVSFPLGNGKKIKIRGRIDRVDEMQSAKGKFAVWDYKTGRVEKYRDPKKFREGRFLQGVFYKALAEARLRASLQPPAFSLQPSEKNKKENPFAGGCRPAAGGFSAEVVSFGYFSPSPRELGERVCFSADEMEAARPLVARLCALLEAGCFPASPDAGDMAFSDYAEDVFFDAGHLAARAEEKIADARNATLAPFRELRSLEEEDDGEE